MLYFKHIFHSSCMVFDNTLTVLLCIIVPNYQIDSVNDLFQKNYSKKKTPSTLVTPAEPKFSILSQSFQDILKWFSPWELKKVTHYGNQ